MVAVLGYVVLPLVLGLGLLVMLVQNGKHLVNKPQLCPNLVSAWTGTCHTAATLSQYFVLCRDGTSVSSIQSNVQSVFPQYN